MALPLGTTGVVARRDGQIAEGRLYAATTLGDNVRARASEVRGGALLIPEGTLMTAGRRSAGRRGRERPRAASPAGPASRCS